MSLAGKIRGKKVVVIVSGGNLDFERLPEIKERALKYAEKKRYYVVNFPQRPGALRDFLDVLGPDDDIARFEYMKKSNRDNAPVFIGIEALGDPNFSSIESRMTDRGFRYEDVTDNDMYFNLLV